VSTKRYYCFISVITLLVVLLGNPSPPLDGLEGYNLTIYEQLLLCFHIAGGKYDGYWENDSRHGFGVETFADGSRYEGHFKNDEKSGSGTYTWTNGQKFVGNFEMGKQNGKGKMLYPRGSVVESREGEWQGNGSLKICVNKIGLVITSNRVRAST